MKTSLVFLTLLILFSAVGCSSFPTPKTENDSLVIGNFVLDYPDGFFGGRPRTIRNGLRLDFLNNTTDQKLIIITKDGYFRIPTNGSDDYILMSYSFEEEYDNFIVKIGPVPVKIPIQAAPGTILYVGHLLLTFSNPDESQITHDGNMSKKSFNYKREIKTDWKEDAIKAYLKETGAQDTWGKLPIVKTGKTEK